MDFDHRPDVSVHYVDSPPRILVDLPETAFALQKGALAPRGLFDSIRYGAMGPGRSRIVLQTKTPARVDLKQLAPGDGEQDVRLILDIATVSQDEFAKLVKAEKWTERRQFGRRPRPSHRRRAAAPMRSRSSSTPAMAASTAAPSA